jgi:hypothetical protein
MPTLWFDERDSSGAARQDIQKHLIAGFIRAVEARFGPNVNVAPVIEAAIKSRPLKQLIPLELTSATWEEVVARMADAGGHQEGPSI